MNKLNWSESAIINTAAVIIAVGIWVLLTCVSVGVPVWVVVTVLRYMGVL